MTITRIPGSARGRSPAVRHDGIVYAVATAASDSSSVAEQTGLALAALDRNLDAAGSDKTRLLQATVYLRDISTKAEMDAVWCDWIGGAENWPQRACVGADLAGDDLVEIVVVAAELVQPRRA
jgi:enamine deaminase RidA (YjgF/YER057c/UK114 family)